MMPCRLSKYIVPMTTFLSTVVVIAFRLSKQAKREMRTSSDWLSCRLSKVYPSHQNHLQHNRDVVMQAVKAGETGDEDIIKLAAEDAELARAKERLTLKHRNSSKWARRALKRGMDVMDEGTKAAVAEQLRLGEELRRKVKTSFESRV